MGYYTDYNLSIRKIKESNRTVINVLYSLGMISDYDFYGTIVPEGIRVNTEEIIDYVTNAGMMSEGIINYTKEKCIGATQLTDVDLESADGIKWYDNETDMKQLASLYPEYAFVLEGRGEDREDWWIRYYQGDTVIERNAELRSPFEVFLEDKGISNKIKSIVNT
jgi:hypothetical protein